MKSLNYLMSVLTAFALIVLFSQCAGNVNQQTANTPAQPAGLSEMKIAYVEIDTLLTKYNFCIDLNEAMVKKSENVRLTLNQKAKELLGWQLKRSSIENILKTALNWEQNKKY